MKRISSFLLFCTMAFAASAQTVNVVSNELIGKGYDPQFAADGRLLYVESEADYVAPYALGYEQDEELYVANEDLRIVLYRNGVAHKLTPHGDDVNYVWISLSPDKTKILFNTMYGTGVCDLEGKEICNLGNINAPVWYGNDNVVGMYDTQDGYFFTSSCIAIRSLDGTLNQRLTEPEKFGMYPTVDAKTGMIAYNTLAGDIRLLKIDMPKAGIVATDAKVVPQKAPAKPKKVRKAKYTSASEVKIYINPGHGGHDPANDRNVVIFPFKAGDPNGFWESNSNLDKGLKLNEWLQREGFQTMMSRTLNRDVDDRALSAIVAEANAYNADFMLSIHSNAGGGAANYVLQLYSGQDANDTRTYTNPAPRQDESRAISTVISNNLIENTITTWYPSSRSKGWVVGDKTFGADIMGGWSDGYGVLRRLAVPGVISEGCMHDYIPEAYRLMNMDYKWKEPWYFMKSFLSYYLDKEITTGVIGGQVRDAYRKNEFPKMSVISGSRDAQEPINQIKVVLLKDGKELQSYTTDTLYNGVFFFWDLEPGTYTVKTESDSYYNKEATVEVVANKIVYQDLLVNAKRGTRPVVLNYSPAPANLTDSVDVTTDIVLNFNWDMKETETRAAFSISPEMPGTITFENSYRTLRFHPSGMFAKATEYTVTLKKSACHPDESQENTMAEDFTFKFRTKDRSSLRLLKAYPADEQTDVPLKASVYLLFDNTVNTSYTKVANFKVTDMNGKSYRINSSSLKFNTAPAPYGSISFDIDDELPADQDFMLSIGKNIQDVLGMNLPKQQVYWFHSAKTAEHSGTMIDDCEFISFSLDKDRSQNIGSCSANMNLTTKYEGKSSNELKYAFTDKDGFVNYRYYGETLISGNGNCQLGMYVYGDFSGNELQAVWDASGDMKYTPITTLDYIGWQYVEADMSILATDVDYQFMGLRIVKEDDLLSESGKVLIDNIYFLHKDASSLLHIAAGDIVVYPNPATTTLTVIGANEQTTLVLYSLDGKRVRQNKGNLMKVEDLENGMYVLRISDSNMSVTKEVIIAR